METSFDSSFGVAFTSGGDVAEMVKPDAAVQAECERLTTAVEEAQREAESAGDALAVAEAKVAEVTSRITASDGASPQIENLAAERAVALARCEALAARSLDKAATLNATRQACAEAEQAVARSKTAAAHAVIAALDRDLAQKLKIVSEGCVVALAEIQAAVEVGAQASLALPSERVLGRFGNEMFTSNDDIVRVFRQGLENATEQRRVERLSRSRGQR
jgi:hypothetical protein